MTNSKLIEAVEGLKVGNHRPHSPKDKERNAAIDEAIALIQSHESEGVAMPTVEEMVQKLTYCGHPKYLQNPVTDSERGLIRDVLSILRTPEQPQEGEASK